MITFEIPATQSGYGFIEFATHVLDYSPANETRSQMRLGGKAIDAIESATKDGLSKVSMPDDVGKHFQASVECAPVPKLFLTINGIQGEAVPKRFFTQFYEAAENGIHTTEVS